MQSLAGGALARPFATHHNALDLPLYLRIALELHLKRLVVGGVDRVYELGRIFRNEGVSTQHNPEFTMLEFYQAYADYGDLMELTEALFGELGQQLCGGLALTYQGARIDLTPPWPRLPYLDAVAGAVGLARAELDDRERLRAAARAAAGRQDLDAGAWGWGAATPAYQMWKDVFETFVEPTLVQPTFVVDFPTELSPLARQKRDDPSLVDRFELFVAWRWRTRTPSSTTRSSSGGASSSSSAPGRPATRRPTGSTRTTSARWSTACRRPPARGSGSTG
jgi:lysyl-tRNA synthetase class 2